MSPLPYSVTFAFQRYKPLIKSNASLSHRRGFKYSQHQSSFNAAHTEPSLVLFHIFLSPSSFCHPLFFSLYHLGCPIVPSPLWFCLLRHISFYQRFIMCRKSTKFDLFMKPKLKPAASWLWLGIPMMLFTFSHHPVCERA